MDDKEFHDAANRIAREIVQRMREETQLAAPGDEVTQGQLLTYASGIFAGVMSTTAASMPEASLMFIVATLEGKRQIQNLAAKESANGTKP